MANVAESNFDPESIRARTCRRCGTQVPAERHESEAGVTWLWRCECGWASARTESGVISRGRARAAIAAAQAAAEREPIEG